MSWALLTATLIFLTATSAAHAKVFTLDSAYIMPDGAIRTYLEKNAIIDPYFPTKALLTAHENGMNISALAKGWINWMLPRQESDGLFARFCYDGDKDGYEACMVADADDSMMAMWTELLYRMAPAGGMPASWRVSVTKALKHLEELYDKESGIYFISKEMPVGLLMDNIEIYASLARSADEAARIGELKQASQFYVKAHRLKAGILKTFWDRDAQRFRVSTQTRTDAEFYPDNVAQMVPLLHGFHAFMLGTQEISYSEWMMSHQDEWFGMIGKNYPWGLLAVIALQHNDVATANCWMQQSAPHRHTGTWDVLDEAAFQTVEWKLQKQRPDSLPACGVAS